MPISCLLSLKQLPPALLSIVVLFQPCWSEVTGRATFTGLHLQLAVMSALVWIIWTYAKKRANKAENTLLAIPEQKNRLNSENYLLSAVHWALMLWWYSVSCLSTGHTSSTHIVLHITLRNGAFQFQLLYKWTHTLYTNKKNGMPKKRVKAANSFSPTD